MEATVKLLVEDYEEVADFALQNNHVHVESVLNKFKASEVEVKDPTKGRFVQLVTDSQTGWSAATLAAGHTYTVRVTPVLVPEAVLVTDGVPSRTVRISTWDGRPNLETIHRWLDAYGLVLKSINGSYPEVRGNYTIERYDCTKPLELQVVPNPRYVQPKVATAHPNQPSWFWQRWRTFFGF